MPRLLGVFLSSRLVSDFSLVETPLLWRSSISLVFLRSTSNSAKTIERTALVHSFRVFNTRSCLFDQTLHRYNFYFSGPTMMLLPWLHLYPSACILLILLKVTIKQYMWFHSCSTVVLLLRTLELLLHSSTATTITINSWTLLLLRHCFYSTTNTAKNSTSSLYLLLCSC